MEINATTIIALVLGVVLCFYGFKIQKLVITLAWFALGFVLSGQICANFINSETTLLIVKVVVGILLASAGYKLEKLALCIAVAYLTYGAIGSYITGFDATMTIVIQVGISIVVGILSTLFIKPILIGVTSIAGSALIKQYLPTLITLQPNVLTIIVLLIAVVGIVVQLKTT